MSDFELEDITDNDHICNNCVCKAELYCAECGSSGTYYCRECDNTLHTFKALASHKRIVRCLAVIPATCTEHKNKVLDVHCKDCSKLICTECMWKRHKGHIFKKPNIETKLKLSSWISAISLDSIDTIAKEIVLIIQQRLKSRSATLVYDFISKTISEKVMVDINQSKTCALFCKSFANILSEKISVDEFKNFRKNCLNSFQNTFELRIRKIPPNLQHKPLGFISFLAEVLMLFDSRAVILSILHNLITAYENIYHHEIFIEYIYTVFVTTGKTISNNAITRSMLERLSYLKDFTTSESRVMLEDILTLDTLHWDMRLLKKKKADALQAKLKEQWLEVSGLRLLSFLQQHLLEFSFDYLILVQHTNKRY